MRRNPEILGVSVDLAHLGAWLLKAAKPPAAINSRRDLSQALLAQVYALKAGIEPPYSPEEMAQILASPHSQPAENKEQK
jgi:hypothetical protein